MLRIPATLSPRAGRFVQIHGVRVPAWTIEQHKHHWMKLGRPADAIEQLIEHQRRWGGLVLPPAVEYEGGPYDLNADDPDCDDDGLVFNVGRPRCSMPYGFAVDSQGRFGICGSGYPWVPLHASIDGWVESLALVYAARNDARLVRRVTGEEADRLIERLADEPPIATVAGLADNWWQLTEALVSVARGESLLFGNGVRPSVLAYEGAFDA
ncbi:hypothetical protein COUCH_15345 [Couchioplanes caeruleus]|uniref:hypothetical protein n=1 Tax=Couchioplanes caeruleus TaxID=56438 RepID=UPI0020C0998D|nr:hypothetical protein [Couchioplanes caeruleus]UQU67557.1 hypothetical protein COUCH_15345 [Couchioplanes caeruleus]